MLTEVLPLTEILLLKIKDKGFAKKQACIIIRMVILASASNYK
jgi:hypothetical protein